MQPKQGMSKTTDSDKFARRLPRYRLLASGLVAITLITCCLQQIVRGDGDPALFVNTAHLLLKHQDIYTLPSPHGNYYYYPPFFACLVIPLMLLPTTLVIILWALASVGLLGWSMAAFYSGMTGQPFCALPAKTRWVVCGAATLLSARFIILHLRFGQTNIFVLALTVLGLTWLMRRQAIRAGFVIALSIAIKLITLPFGFWFLARRSGKVLLGLILGGAIGVAVPACVVGVRQDVDYHREWVTKVVLATQPGTGNWANVGDISLRAQLDRFFLPKDAFEYKGRLYRVTLVSLPIPIVRLLGLLLLLAVALVISLYAVLFRRAPPLISQWGGFAFVFSLIPSFATVSEIPHLVLLVPAYLYVVHLWYVLRLKDRLFRYLVVLSFIFSTLTTNTIVGLFLSRLLTALGFINLGLLLLSAAIFRAAVCAARTDRIGESVC
jgi:Glycosyltransferase family 87